MSIHRKTKILWNRYFKNSELEGLLTNFKLSKKLKDKDNPEYRALLSAVSQQVCKQVYLAYKSSFLYLRND